MQKVWAAPAPDAGSARCHAKDASGLRIPGHINPHQSCPWPSILQSSPVAIALFCRESCPILLLMSFFSVMRAAEPSPIEEFFFCIDLLQVKAAAVKPDFPGWMAGWMAGLLAGLLVGVGKLQIASNQPKSCPFGQASYNGPAEPYSPTCHQVPPIPSHTRYSLDSSCSCICASIGRFRIRLLAGIHTDIQT